MTPDLFTQAPPADPIGAATRKGATFARIPADPAGNTWAASAHRKGRAVALVEFHGTSQESVATAFCHYFHLKA